MINETGFYKWMCSRGIDKRVISNCISRLKRLEKELKVYDIDAEYNKDKCLTIVSKLKNKGKELESKKNEIDLPIGKFSLATYRYSLNKYISFRSETTSNN